MKKSLATLLLASMVASAFAADDRRAGVDPIKLVPLDASAFVQVRVKRFLDSKAGKMFAEKMPKEVASWDRETQKSYGLKLAEVESITYVWPKLEAAKSSEPPVVMIVTREPYDRAKLEKGVEEDWKTRMKGDPKPKVVDQPKSLNERNTLAGPRYTVYFFGPDLLVFGHSPTHVASLVELLNRKSKHGPLEPATRVASAEMSLAAGAGGESGLPWQWPKPMEVLEPIRAANSIGLGIMVRDGVGARVYADFPPGLAAEGQDAASQLPRLSRVIANPPPNMAYLKVAAPLLQAARAEVEGPTLKITSGIPPEGVTAIVTGMVTAAQKTDEISQLRALGIAMHSFHNGNDQKFPAHAIYSEDGKPLLSWRVSLLPHLGQKSLYDKFHRDEPWDSEHNKTLISQMPAVFAPIRVPQPREKGLTHYQLFVGNGAAWPKSKESFGLKQVTDGTSNTMMLVQATEPVVWTKPEDFEYDKEKPLQKLGVGGQTVLVVLFDGSVKEMPAKWPEKSWRAIITAAGSESVDWPK